MHGFVELIPLMKLLLSVMYGVQVGVSCLVDCQGFRGGESRVRKNIILPFFVYCRQVGRYVV